MRSFLLVAVLSITIPFVSGCDDSPVAPLSCYEECDQRWGAEAEALGDSAKNYNSCNMECSDHRSAASADARGTPCLWKLTDARECEDADHQCECVEDVLHRKAWAWHYNFLEKEVCLGGMLIKEARAQGLCDFTEQPETFCECVGELKVTKAFIAHHHRRSK